MIFRYISCHRFSFFARTIPGLEFFQGLYQSLTIVFGLEKNNVATKKANWGKNRNLKKAIFYVLRHNRC